MVGQDETHLRGSPSRWHSASTSSTAAGSSTRYACSCRQTARPAGTPCSETGEEAPKSTRSTRTTDVASGTAESRKRAESKGGAGSRADSAPVGAGNAACGSGGEEAAESGRKAGEA